MEIEEEIKDINSDTVYRQIKRNMDILGASTVGSRNIQVGAPYDMDKIVVVRRRSTDAEEMMNTYRSRLQEFDSRIEKLTVEKSGLKRRLFT